MAAIIGAGAIGPLLLQAGRGVSLVEPPDYMGAIRSAGLKVDGCLGTFRQTKSGLAAGWATQRVDGGSAGGVTDWRQARSRAWAALWRHAARVRPLRSTGYTVLVRERRSSQLDQWIADVHIPDHPSSGGFSRNLRRDWLAIYAGFTAHWELRSS